MRVIFAGTPAFAVPALHALAAARHDLVLVLTQPDRPAGRGLRMVVGPVKEAAQQRGIVVHQPATLKDPSALVRLADAHADVMVVAAYGLILPQAALDCPRYGALNIHASLLPRWRGAAPVQRALLAGDAQTGICIMQMDAGLDTGPVVLSEAMPIAPEDTAGALERKLADLGARLIVAALADLARGALRPTPQYLEGVTYAHKIGKAEARIDWTRPAPEIDRQVRAFNPSPGAVARLRDEDIKVWSAAPLPASGAPPGTILRVETSGIDVACGAGALRLRELQRPGGRRLAVAAFLRGRALAPGDAFAVAAPIASSPRSPS
ncbi:MAG: methionyl-tRNA formyltransferase [Burkholderiales bacterium]